MDNVKVTPVTNETKLVVSSQVTENQVIVNKESREETVNTRRFDGQPAVVSLTFGATIETGEYQFARVDVGVYVPCAPDKAEIEKTYEEARAFVSEKIKSEISSIKEKMAGKALSPRAGVIVEGAPLDF